MKPIEEYSRQFHWRAWPAILDVLPDVRGQTVMDMGCGIGDLAVLLASRGAHVIGVDSNADFISHAIDRNIANTEFRVGELSGFKDPALQVDGIWSSFTAAYFPALSDVVESWTEHLRPAGWLALTEVDDLFAHEPLSDRARDFLSRYVDDSSKHSRYDFRMGRKIPGVLQQLGLTIVREFIVPDQELSFSGPASAEVLDAWRARFDRMQLLRAFCGAEFEGVRDEFLACLQRDDHRADATVRCCLAIRSDA